MDIITIVASAMLVIGCLYIILSPFIQKSSVAMDKQVMEMDDALTKQELYATLNEIEMDYKMHKLSEEDYRNMKSTYEQMVADIMKSESKPSGKNRNQTTGTGDRQDLAQIENEIEAELQALRNERKGES